MSELSDAAESRGDDDRRGAVLAVIGGRGGAGASVFATALAHAAPRRAAGRRRPVGRRHRPGAGQRARRRDCAGPTWRCGGGRVGYAGAARGAARRATASPCCRRVDRRRDRRGALGAVDRRRLPRRRHRRLRPAAACHPRRRSGARRRRSRRAGHAGRRPVVCRRRRGRAVAGGRPTRTSAWSCGARAGWAAAADVARIAGLPLLAAMRPQPGLAARTRARRAQAAAPVAADVGGPARARGAAPATWRDRRAGGRMSASLIDRVRERLAAESAPLRPNVVADAIRAESGGVLGDTDVLTNLRAAADRADRRRHPRTAAVRGGHHRRPGHGTGLGLGRRRSRSASHRRSIRRRGRGAPAGAAAGARRRAPTRRGAALGRRAAAGSGRGRLHRATARGSAADRGRGHLPVAAGAAARHPGPRGARRLPGRSPPDAVGLLGDVIAARLAFLVSGGTGAGKTTLLSAALGAVAPDERIVCVEDAPELAPRHPHLVKLVARVRQRRGRRRGDGARPRPAGAADATRPDRRR